MEFPRIDMERGLRRLFAVLAIGSVSTIVLAVVGVAWLWRHVAIAWN